MRRALAVIVACVAAGAVLTACSGSDDEKTDAARSAAKAYLKAWTAGDATKAAKATSNADTAKAVLEQADTALGVKGPAKAELSDVTLGDGGDSATATVHVTWKPAGTPSWAYDTELRLHPKGDSWQVEWSPEAVHPDLRDGMQLTLERTQPDRAPLLDAAGNPLFTAAPVVQVGIQPSKVTDLNALAQALAAALGIDAAAVVNDVTTAQQTQPDAFVPVITLRQADYEQVKPQIYDLPGTVFTEATQQLAPTPTYAAAMLGRVGQATAEVMDAAGPTALPSDQVGLSGLQLAYQKELAGTPGFTVSAAPPPGSADQTPPVELGSVEPKPGTPVQTTLDTTVQNAADAAVATQSAPTHIVAVRPSTGAVLAVSSNAPANPTNALSGTFPPGSTFKVVSASAALESGLTPDTPVGCPGTTVVDGRQIENEDAFDLGTIPLSQAFAHSCNTSFVGLAGQLPDDALPTAAAQFGIGADWDTPVDTASGEVPPPASPVEKAEDVIGQGKVLVSPFAMALVAATAAHGSTPAPMMVVDKPAEPKNPPTTPPAEVISQLQPMMRSVVTDGTAKAMADLPGDPAGKTGTAEYGTGEPPPAHAWFVGYRGDLAFAVLVEGGESSATTAVPVAQAFLTALP